MRSILRKIEPLSIEDYVNCILVSGGLRTCYLMQPIDYKEYDNNGPITKAKIEKIEELFPNLNIFNDYPGVIFSVKERLRGPFYALLDYPCDLDVNTQPYGYSIVCYTTTGKFYLYSFRAPDESYKEETMERVNLYREFLMEDPRTRMWFAGMELLVEKHLSEDECISNILKGSIDSNTVKEIVNYLENLGFERYQKILNLMDWNNKIHIGIIVGLLMNYKNNPLRPFFPLQDYPTKFNEVNSITQEWENSLIQTLKDSQTL